MHRLIYVPARCSSMYLELYQCINQQGSDICVYLLFRERYRTRGELGNAAVRKGLAPLAPFYTAHRVTCFTPHTVLKSGNVSFI